MNEPRASRYHRAKRRAGCLWAITTVLFLAAVVVTGASVRLRDLTGGLVAPYLLVLSAVYALVTLPVTYYRGCRLERVYELSETSPGVWLRDYSKTALLNAVLAVAAAEIVYRAMSASPAWWWLIAAVAIAALVALLTVAAPIVILPLFHTYRPLVRPSLRERVVALTARAGLRAFDVYEWRLGARDRRALAAIVGAGATRRIVLSDTLLRDYSDDEIEVIVAHEIGHHLHRDVVKALAAELAVMIACFYVADAVLARWWRSLTLLSPGDPAGAPMVILVALAVWGVAMPILNAVSRRNERRADALALNLTARADAFIAAVRRMAAQNLADERPSRLTLFLFHGHPAVADRIAAAQAFIAAQALAGDPGSAEARVSSAASAPRSPAETAGV